jgi:hypothetical protein
VTLYAEFVKSLLLTEFPSGSSINFYKDKLYLIGDDATHILVLDKEYQRLDEIALFKFDGKRISKEEKIDLETSTILTLNSIDYLLVVGSASRKKRKRILLIPLESPTGKTLPIEAVKIKAFAERLEQTGMAEVNIEGSCVIGTQLILSSRGNRANPVSFLIRTNYTFWQNQEDALISIASIQLPLDAPAITVSELNYDKPKDILLLTFSMEATDNAYEDGAIGESYFGWITEITKKINQDNVHVEGLIKLSDVHDSFKGEKIEGICIEDHNTEHMIAHLISDNDLGESKLFKLRLTCR